MRRNKRGGISVGDIFKARLQELQELLFATGEDFPLIYALNIQEGDVWGDQKKPRTMMYLLAERQQALDEDEITLKEFGHLLHAAASYLIDSPQKTDKEKLLLLKRMEALVPSVKRFVNGNEAMRSHLASVNQSSRLFAPMPAAQASRISETLSSLSNTH